MTPLRIEKHLRIFLADPLLRARAVFFGCISCVYLSRCCSRGEIQSDTWEDEGPVDRMKRCFVFFNIHSCCYLFLLSALGFFPYTDLSGIQYLLGLSDVTQPST